MRISARADYAVRAAVALAHHTSSDPLSADTIAQERDIPARFLESILTALRRAGIVTSRRGVGGGYLLVVPAEKLTVADVIRAVEGPLIYVRDERPSELEYSDDAEGSAMVNLWVALRASVRSVLEVTTIHHLASHRLPDSVQALVDDPASWSSSSVFGD